MPLHKSLVLLIRAVVFAVISMFATMPAAHAAGSIVITQIYGAGGLSGANYRQDFITLFNPTPASITANGWAIQYRSVNGSAAFTVWPLPAFTLAPGQYYQVTASATTLSNSGSLLPLPGDYLLTSQFPGPAASDLNLLSSASATIALTSSTTPIPAGSSGSACPALSAANVVDVVGYGGSNCFEGTGSAPGFTTPDILIPGYTVARSTSVTRRNKCIDTGDNSTDFVTTPLTFFNSTSPKTPCPATRQLTALATVLPGAVYPGSPITLSVEVSPASGPTSIGITVNANLGGIGGPSSQLLYDDGTHGDAVAGDGVYSISTTVGSSTVSGVHSLNITVTDVQSNTYIAPATFTVSSSRITAPIHAIQTGVPDNTANIGTVYTTSGIVTGRRANGFYLQGRDSAADSDPSTTEAIFVDTSFTTMPAMIAVGNEVQVTGVLAVVPSSANPTSSAAPYYGTELTAPTNYVLLSNSNPLPAPIVLTAADAAQGEPYGQRYKYQSMRVSIPSVTAVSGTGGTLAESTKTYLSNGHFYGVVTGTPRPFREPGLSLADPVPAGAPSTVQSYDGNTEAIAFDSMALGGSAIDVTSNTVLSNVVGIDDYSTGAEQLLIDSTTRPSVGTLSTYSPVITREPDEFTVGTLNMQRFYSSTPSAGAVTLSSDAYQRRLAKASLSIRKVLFSPDILAIQEMGTLATLTELANKINADAISASDDTLPNYLPYLLPGNDPNGLNNAFLVNANRVTVNSIVLSNKTATFTDASGTAATLYDDPPLVLDATINATSTTAAYSVVVVNNELASANDNGGSTTSAATQRIKRQQQAQVLASVLQGAQAVGRNVIAVGDYNAPEFSDGYVDVTGLIEGTPTNSSLVTLGTSSSYIAPNPTLWDLTVTAQAPNRYSYTSLGSVAAMDHFTVTEGLAPGYMVYAHDSVDFPAVYRNDATRPEGNSDHDGAVAYFPLAALGATSSASLTPGAAQDFGSISVNSSSTGQNFTFSNTGNVTLTGITVSITGSFAQTSTCRTTLSPGSYCNINVVFTPTTIAAQSGMLTVASSSTANPTLSVTLTGTGAATSASTASLTPSSQYFGTIPTNTNSQASIFLFTNTGKMALTGINISSTGDYSQTNNCGTTLASCTSCVINVVFHPTSNGSRTGSLVVTSSSATNPTLTSSLTGTGADASTSTASVTPASKDFGSVVVNGTSAATVFPYINTGTATMSGLAITTTGDFFQTNSCGFFIHAGSTCNISVTFKPTAAGVRSGSLNVSTNNVSTGTVATTVPLSGNGLSSTATLTPATANFTSVIVGTNSTASAFNFTNTGNTALTGVSVTISGSFSQTNNCTATLAAGAGCTVNVVFRPTTTGALTGTLTVHSSSTTDPTLTSALSGTGIAATTTVTLSPATKDFGTSAIGSISSPATFTFSNTGNSTLTGVTVNTTGNFSQTNNCASTLTPINSCSISVTFNPTASGPLTGTLAVASSSTTTPIASATLSGTGTVVPTSTATLTPVSQDFGTLTVGSTSAATVFTFTNTGNTALTAVMVASSGNFSQTNNCNSTLAVASACTIRVVFSPATAGTLNGTLTVASSSVSNPILSSTLIGIGITAPAPDFILSATGSTTATVNAGSAASFIFGVASTGGYTGTIHYTCSGAPTYSTCQVSPASTTLAANATASATINIATSVTSSSSIGTLTGPFALFGMFSLGLLYLARRRGKHLMSAGLLLLLLMAALQTTGCGSGNSNSGGGAGTVTHTTSPGTYSYVLSATDGTTTHTLPFTLTVH